MLEVLRATPQSRGIWKIRNDVNRPPPAQVLTLFLLLALTSNLTGGETGVIPYGTVAKVLDGFTSVKEKDKLQLSVKVVPAKKARLASPIALEIHATKGRIPLNLAENGELVDFPLTPELRAENPPVFSNQPKGTLALQASIAIRYPGKLTESAQWYEDALRQANGAVRSAAGLMSFTAPRAKTIVFVFAPGSSDFVTLKSAGGEKPVPADDKGNVRLKLGDEAELGTAVVVLSSPPKIITVE